jgi:hypothetical protein
LIVAAGVVNKKQVRSTASKLNNIVILDVVPKLALHKDCSAATSFASSNQSMDIEVALTQDDLARMALDPSCHKS